MLAVKQLDLLEQELKMMLENIERVKQYKKEQQAENWKPYQSAVIGELKHRSVSLKQRLTLISKITTSDLFNN